MGTVSIGGVFWEPVVGEWRGRGGVSRSIKLGIRYTGRVVGCPKKEKKKKHPKPPLVFFLRCALLSSTASSPPPGFICFFLYALCRPAFYCAQSLLLAFVSLSSAFIYSFCLDFFYSLQIQLYKKLFFCGVRYRLILSSLFLDCFPFLVHIPVQQGLLDLNYRLVC